jgi:hypothetical protein
MQRWDQRMGQLNATWDQTFGPACVVYFLFVRASLCGLLFICASQLAGHFMQIQIAICICIS